MFFFILFFFLKKIGFSFEDRTYNFFRASIYVLSIQTKTPKTNEKEKVDALIRQKFTRLLCSVDRNELNCCARLKEHGKIGSCNNFYFFSLFKVMVSMCPLNVCMRVHCTNTHTYAERMRGRE